MNQSSINRRHFLKGLGGFSLAVPFMGSLLPREARAQAAMQRQKRFVFIGSDHGGIYPQHMYPEVALTNSSLLLGASGRAPDHRVHWSPLNVSINGSSASLSPVLSGPNSRLTQAVADKMNVIAGLDFSTYLGHHRALLGNMGSNDGGDFVPMASIDQLIAWNSAFNVDEPRQRSVAMSTGYANGSTLRYSQSARRSAGQLSAVQPSTDPRQIWRSLFDGFTAPEPGETRPLVVDRVINHYQSLRNGALGPSSRLSKADRDRLDAHMQALFELERKMDAPAPSPSCTTPDSPSGGNARQKLEQAMAITAAGIKCGLTHVATFGVIAEPLSQSTAWNNWHEQIAHAGSGSWGGHNPAYQQVHVDAQRAVFESTFLTLVEHLDQDAGEGQTYLDDTLIAWSMESGEQTHNNYSTPVVTAGSAGGYFATGRFVDLRNHDNMSVASSGSPFRRPGTMYARFLSNVMQSMGLTPADWASELRTVQNSVFEEGARGYGYYNYHPSSFWMSGVDLRRDVWPEQHWRNADEPIPGWVVG